MTTKEFLNGDILILKCLFNKGYETFFHLMLHRNSNLYRLSFGEASFFKTIDGLISNIKKYESFQLKTHSTYAFEYNKDIYIREIKHYKNLDEIKKDYVEFLI